MKKDMGKWLTDWEIGQMADTLVKFDVEIIGIDEADGELSVTLENARQHPEAIGYLSDTFKNAITRLHPDILVESNAGVSTLVPLLAREMNLPYIKFNPATGELDNEIRGRSIANKRAVILSDVVQDAESFMPIYRACQRRRLQIESLVALVDMGTTWQREFERYDMDLNVWPGCHIDDIRMALMDQGHLMDHRGVRGATSPLVISLEGKKWVQAMAMARQLRAIDPIYKISDQLVEYGCDEAITRLSAYGRVIADLNIANTPEITGDICTRLRSYVPWAVTVNGFAGEKVARIAVKTLQAAGVKVLVNAILPTLDKADLGLLHGSPQPDRLVDRIAEIANAADADGVICAPEYIQSLRARYPEMSLLAADEQGVGNATIDSTTREGKALEALKHGADHVAIDMFELESGDPLARARALSEKYLEVRENRLAGHATKSESMRNVTRLEAKSG